MSNIAIRSFVSGEVAPSFYARTDLQRYAAALRTCRNFVCLRDGGVANRAGTELVSLCEVQATTRTLPFVNDGQSYVLEFGRHTVRIIQDGATIGVSVATPYLATEVFGLQITQSANVVTIVHPNHPVMELTRTSALVWSLAAVVFGISIAAPANLVTNYPLLAGTAINWVVTAVSEPTHAESYPSAPVGVIDGGMPTAGTLLNLGWDPVVGASRYNVYKSFNAGGYGFIGTTQTTNFEDNRLTPDYEFPPIALRILFAASGDYPSAVGNFDQRRIVAGSINSPETFWTSRVADPRNFTVSFPTQDDDAITATLKAKKAQPIRHIVDGDALFLFTDAGEWKLRGDQAGILRPTDINPLNFSKHGASPVPPLSIDRSVLYVQARQSIVREIVSNEVGEGYVGASLSLFASHLFKGYTLVDWAYSEEPNAVIWCVRSDGALLGLTYLPEQKMVAWHRHDTDGLVESVCVVPEGDEDRLYLVVNRAGVRMVERMASRFFADIQDAVFMDSAVSLDGRNTSAVTMTLSGGSTWASDEMLTLTRSAAGFAALDVGNAIDFTGALDEMPLRFTIEGYTGDTVVTGHVSRTVPADLRTVATAAWSLAVTVMTGLSHLEGKAVAVTADGVVVASPNNAEYDEVVVSGGSITLERPYAYIRAGLPYISDLETLDIDTPSGQSLKQTKMLPNGVIVWVESSRGFFAGQEIPTGTDPLENIDEAKVRDVLDNYGQIALQTDTVDVDFPAEWNSKGRVAIRNVDPLPLTILAVMPRGHLASGG